MDTYPLIDSLVHNPTQQSLNPLCLRIHYEKSSKYDGAKVNATAYYRDVRLRKTSHYTITFTCQTCSRPSSSMLLSNFLKKKRPSLTCSSCNKEVCGAKDTSLKHTSNYEASLNGCVAMCQCCTSYFHMRTFKTHLHHERPIIVCPDCVHRVILNTKPKAIDTFPDVSFLTPFERKFLLFCMSHSIHIVNGPLVTQTHRIAFIIPSMRYYIDVRSNIAWNGRQRTHTLHVPLLIQDIVESDYNGKYMVIYPRTYLFHTRQILRQKQNAADNFFKC